MNHRRRTDTHHELDLDWRIDRQGNNPNRATRMPACFAKDFTQQLTCTVRNQRLIGEIRGTRDVDRRLDDPGDHIQIASQIDDGRQSIERRDPSTVDRVIDRDFCTDLANRS